jgi:hypothetical protein
MWKKKKCEKKKIYVWRYKELIIVYIKRLILNECESVKMDKKVKLNIMGISVKNKKIMKKGKKNK